jgi:ornithine carbamoyltransferase
VNLISLSEWAPEDVLACARLSLEAKRDPARFARALEGKVLLMIFQKPSLRTRVSFEAAMLRTGGHAIHYDLEMSPMSLGKETPEDMARTASRYVDAIMARLFDRRDMRALAAGASVPVINGLTDFEHPCQALGDLATLLERRGRLAGLTLAYVGDANNNVTHSLLDGCALAGVHLRIGCPPGEGYAPDADVLARARRFAAASGARVEVLPDARAAVAGADAVYTDTWMSYHIPREREAERRRALEPYRVTEALMDAAGPGALFMHCLPVRRGAEASAEVVDGPRSIVFDQAENRLHSEVAILLTLLGRAAARSGAAPAPRGAP